MSYQNQNLQEWCLIGCYNVDNMLSTAAGSRAAVFVSFFCCTSCPVMHHANIITVYWEQTSLNKFACQNPGSEFTGNGPTTALYVAVAKQFQPCDENMQEEVESMRTSPYKLTRLAYYIQAARSRLPLVVSVNGSGFQRHAQPCFYHLPESETEFTGSESA